LRRSFRPHKNALAQWAGAQADAAAQLGKSRQRSLLASATHAGACRVGFADKLASAALPRSSSSRGAPAAATRACPAAGAASARAEVGVADALVAEQLTAGAGHGDVAGLEHVADVGAAQRGVGVL